jgi:hypothetical protein
LRSLEYLSRYLYRGIISENDILSGEQGQVPFRYQESKTLKVIANKRVAEDFLLGLLKHVLPRVFCRVRTMIFFTIGFRGN